MKTSSFSRHIKAFLIPALLFVFPLAQAQTRAQSISEITSLSAGAPENLGKKLGEQSYVKIETLKLTQAKVMWLNWDYLQKAGFEVGNRELTPAIEKAVLDAFAWGLPSAKEPAAAFSANEKKTFYADRYGGDGLAGNMGSGRAASAGKIQIKGIGKTPLVTMTAEDHSNGNAEFEEAIREAVYGEVGQALPFGANRVIAVIDRGTTTTYNSGHVQNNALIVREDSLRPSHYMKNLWGRGPFMETEDQRTQEALAYFRKAFPVPKELQNASDTAQIHGAVFAYADRIAAQFAAAYALKIYHGATSPSNIEISGRFIDYGTITTLFDYGKVKILQINDAFGDTNEFREILMLEFLQNIRSQLPAHLAAGLPTDKELGDHFLEQYRRYHHREFLRLTGLSLEQALQLEAKPESWALTDLMEEVATKDARSLHYPQDATPLTRFNLNRIIVKMAGVEKPNPKNLEAAIASEMNAPEDKILRRKLIKAYLDAIPFVSVDRVAMYAEAQNRNAEHPETFRWNLEKSVATIINDYKKNGNTELVSKKTDEIIHQFKAPAKTVRSCRDLFT